MADSDDLVDALATQIKCSNIARERACIDQDFGMCNNCGNLGYILYELGDYEAFCYAHDGYKKPLTHTKKIVKCSNYFKKGEMSLWDMQTMAWDINTRKKIAGFGKDE